MCAHNHSKGDAADPVDDHVTATIRGEPRPLCSTLPVAKQPGVAPGNPKHLKNREVLE